MKKTYSKLVAAIALAFVAPAAFAEDDGDIYEFKPVTPVVTSDSAFGAAQTINFKMRLLSPNYINPEEASRIQWQIFYKPDPFLSGPGAIATYAAAWAMRPLQLGIVVSGQTRGATVTFPEPIHNRRLSELDCSYTTKYGDLALPVKLATDGNGTAVGDGQSGEFVVSTDGKYYFLNSDLWGIGYTTDGTSVTWLKPYRRQGNPPAMSAPDGKRNGSYDLAYNFDPDTPNTATSAYFIKTIGFDSKSETDSEGTYWRIVNEKRTTCKPDVPAIVVDSTPENPQDLYVYVWSEDDSIVTLKFSDSDTELAAADVTQETFKDREGTSRQFWVKKIRLDGVNTEYTFSIRGADGMHGHVTKLVMSAAKGYRFDGTGDLLEDFLTADVKCGDPLKPTITVKVNGLSSDTVTAKPQSSVATRVATLTVELSDPYTSDLFVAVDPKLTVSGSPGSSALDYFGISKKSDSLSYLDKEVGVTISAGSLKETLFVYSWGADANTYGVNKSVGFYPSVSDPDAAAFYAGGMEEAFLLVKTIKPEIIEPVADQLISANASVPYPLTVKIDDTYNDMKSDTGYELYIKRDVSDLTFEKLGNFKPDADGVLYSIPTAEDPDSHLPQVTWENTATDKAVLYVKSPESKEKSEERQIAVYVKPARQIAITPTDGKEGNQYLEGDDVNVTVTLENGINDRGETIYAFLVPQGEATNAVSATWLAKPGCSGRPIPKSGSTVNGIFSLIDGTFETKQGATYDFKVELRTKQSYSEGSTIAGFESKTMTIYSQNVIPTAEYVEMDDGVDYVYQDGGTFETIIAKNVPVKFKMQVDEPGTYDKETTEEGKKFKTRWRVTEPGKSAYVVIVEGDPDTHSFTTNFTKAGTVKIEVDFQDKDMTYWGNGEKSKKFTFQIEVVTNPQITITTYSGLSNFEEIECWDNGGEATIDVNVSMNPLDEPLEVQLTIVPPSYSSADNPGKFKLMEESGICRYTGQDAAGNDVYVVTLDGILSQTVAVQTLDGTPLSKKAGFTIESKVLNETLYPNGSGERSCDYYIGVNRKLLVLNADPVSEITDFYPPPGSTNYVAIGKSDKPIEWDFTDVDSDFEKGITVTIKGGGGFVTNIYSQATSKGSWYPTFSQSGLSTITMTIVDKDGGRVRFPELIWYYQVAVSKKLIVVPHGPTTGKRGANSTRYSEADGLGEGHVYSRKDRAEVSRFSTTYNCGLSDNATIWGFGYKVANPIDNGTLDDLLDTPLSPSGNLADTGLSAESYYNYRPAYDLRGKPLDSFLYAWLIYGTADGNSGGGGNSGGTSGMSDSLLSGTIVPEHAEIPATADAGALIALPSELQDNEQYADMIVEAIFSREYRAGDNMGDINQDGIPDRFIVKYGLGVYDTVASAVTGNDLENVADFNEDGEYLPATPSATLSLPTSSNAWTVASMPFSAIYEIRGYHDGLNIPGVTEMDMSDVERRAFKRYLLTKADSGDPDVTAAIAAFSPTEDKTSDAYTNETAKLEVVFHKGINGIFWTPENPTDPTKEDTDGDGIPDGYEYYFWYSAHVMGATGERYGFWGGDISKPIPIDSETIAFLFNPNIKRNWNSSGQFATDTDGDGLPDLVEFALGTNPVHWDSDGDGVPDGLEVMRGTDPLKYDSTGDVGNPDGDFMAYVAKPDQLVVEINNGGKLEIWSIDNVHSKSATTGKTYYKYRMVSWEEAEKFEHIAYALMLKNNSGDDVPQYLFLTDKDDEDEAKAELAKYADEDQVLVDMPVRKLYSSAETDENGKKVVRYWIGAETTLSAGFQLTVPPNDEDRLAAPRDVRYVWANLGEEATPRYGALVDGVHDDENIPNGLDPAAVPGLFRVYRAGNAENGPYNVKMPCYLNVDPTAKNQIKGSLTYYGGSSTETADLSGADDSFEIVRIDTAANVGRIHAQVFAENGFDPRTGWGRCQHGYCAARWCDVCSSNPKSAKKAGAAGLAVNTAAYTSLEEYRVMHYRYLNGLADSAKDLADVVSGKKTLEAIWRDRTTNPQVTYSSTSADGASAVASHGADTDGDGSPDGWELYVLKNPNDASGSDVSDDEWDLVHVDGGWSHKEKPGDGLEHPAEFAGTDTLLAYADCPSIGGKMADWFWLNKFFPTNPYSSDTDGDGLSDAEEQAVGMERNDYSKTQYGNSDPRVKPTSFIYGRNKDKNMGDNDWGYPDDDGSTCIRGGGLNPCTIDTDGDRLPDGWEYQFAGIYRASASAAKEEGGYIDFGMDGTDPYDVCTYKRGSLYPEDVDPRTGTLRNFDFDLDGLQNYQEYLTQALRHLRYDVIRLGTTMETGGNAPIIEGMMDGTPLYQMTLLGPIDYVFGPVETANAKPADDATRRGFFGAPPHAWDFAALREGGTRYARFMLTPGTTWAITGFADRLKPNGYVAAHSYATTDPRMRDSDLDGMDDFYEVFHGLNPLLGTRNALGGGGGDLIAAAYEDSSVVFGDNELEMDCFNNWFSMPNADGMQLESLPMDFVRFPWLAGMSLADPDGDGLRNDQEMIQVNAADPQASNTDPTPLWMTDPTYSYSYTAQYYRQGVLRAMWPLASNAVAGAADLEQDDYMFSFEMNEGYDTDGDGIPDGQEITKTVRGKSDPQLFTDPALRQALYFPGPVNGSSSLAISYEPAHPANTTTRRVTSAADIFRQFTVECWIRPEASSLATDSKCTVLERVCAYPQSNYLSSDTEGLEASTPDYTGDEKHYVRATFRIGIESGHLYGLIDNSDAKLSESYLGVSSAKVLSDVDLAADKWYHVAITYDGSEFAIIVNSIDDANRKGRRQTVTTSIIPANGVTEILQQVNSAFPYYSYLAYDSAFLLGASTDEIGMNLQNADTPPTAENYSRHYVGYIGEVRVWDGARTVDDIAADYDRKLAYDEAVKIRNDVYDSWANGGSRSKTDGTEVLPPELIQQYTFDGLHGATAPEYVATAPAAFSLNVKTPAATALSAINGEKIDVNVGWLAALDPSLRPTVYTDYAYVPWVKNVVAHLPLMDGSVADSAYWGENLAGDHTPAEVGVARFVFPRTANPYAFVMNYRDLTIRHARYTVLDGGKQDEDSVSTNATTTSSVYAPLLKLYRFDLRSRMSSTSDLVPLGGVYAKRCEDFWDGQGAMDADLITTDGMTAADLKGNGLPDWWEEYCRDNYFSGMGYDPGMVMTLDTFVNYGGIHMKASEAYLRDLAKGLLPTTEIDDSYADVADFDYDGIPDWWEKLYGIDTGSVADAKADDDNDGLNNLTEYILSERFDLRDANGDRKVFSPVDARTGGTVEPDYFFRVGSLYVGEIFADHDWIEDWWEEGYRADYVSTLVYDTASDNDGDGWSAWAEARYSQQVSPIVANNLFHYNVTDGLVPDYPIPTIQLKVHYNGSRAADVRNASIGVKIGRTLDPAKSFDAEYYIQGTAKTAEVPTNGDSDTSSNLYTHVIGKWSNRHVYGTLTPGFINPSSIALQSAFDPSSEVYSWTVHGDVYRRGTKDEYNQDCRTYGTANVTLLSTSDGYKDIKGMAIGTDLTSEIATIRFYGTGKFANGPEVGTVNLKTGEYDLDLGIFEGGVLIGPTNANDVVSLEDQTYRLVYSANKSTGIPRDLYLGEADTGCIYEGLNSIMVWADVDGNGDFDVGEPFGFVRDVDIGWRRRAVEVEILDSSAAMPRVNLLTATSDRAQTLADYFVAISNRYVATLPTQAAREQAAKQLSWTATNRYEVVQPSAVNGELTRVRVVRWAVNGNPVYRLGFDARVVFDKMFDLAAHPTLTEADLMIDGALDLDWNYLTNDVRQSDVRLSEIDSIAYIIVIGDGLVQWRSEGDSETVVKVVDQVIERRFDATQATPSAYSPKAEQSMIYAARPTFSWEIPGSVETGYTAFRAQILSETGDTVVWDSGERTLPSRDFYGRYVWTAPAYVGHDLDASVNYRWRVTALNAKFHNPKWSDAGIFRMEPNTVGADCGRIDVCVKYFGPTAEVLDAGRVVVEAFESPDFTGDPVARAIVTNTYDVAAVETEHVKQVSLIGLRKGVYYIRAYIDSDSYGTEGVRDSWESWGYDTDRSGTSENIFAPRAVTIDDTMNKGDLVVVYIEDTDVNGNRLPDAWEMYVNGGELSNGTADIDATLDCGLAVKTSISDNLPGKQVGDSADSGMIAHYSRTLSSRGMVALALGVPPEDVTVNSAGQIVVENKVESVEVESISFEGGLLSIKVSGTVGAAAEGASSGLYEVTVAPTKTVVCDVYRRATLAAEDDWECVYTSDPVTVGADAKELSVPGATGESGFYKVVIRQ